jgi:uncharacterized protein (DUF3820 family)
MFTLRRSTEHGSQHVATLSNNIETAKSKAKARLGDVAFDVRTENVLPIADKTEKDWTLIPNGKHQGSSFLTLPDSYVWWWYNRYHDTKSYENTIDLMEKVLVQKGYLKTVNDELVVLRDSFNKSIYEDKTNPFLIRAALYLCNKTLEWFANTDTKNIKEEDFRQFLDDRNNRDIQHKSIPYPYVVFYTSTIPSAPNAFFHFNSMMDVLTESGHVVIDGKIAKKEDHAKVNGYLPGLNVGDKVNNLKATLKFDTSFGSAYGTVNLYSFVDDDGRVIVYKGSSTLYNNDGELLKRGDIVQLSGTVKEFSEYRDVKQTILQRMKITQ